ncbi:DUF3983 domain-containing protein [Bacillus thuringiensis]
MKSKEWFGLIAIARRAKDVEKFQVNKAWRNIFVQAGILK